MVLWIRSLYFLKKIVIENYVFVPYIGVLFVHLILQDAFHLESNDIATFKISCRPDFQDEYVVMFALMFL